MTREEFKEVLDEERYLYRIYDDKIAVNYNVGHCDIYLNEIKSLPNGAIFINRGDIYLDSVTNIPSDVELNNMGNVWLNNIGWFNNWKGNIEGIDSNILLNYMISKGLFER